MFYKRNWKVKREKIIKEMRLKAYEFYYEERKYKYLVKL